MSLLRKLYDQANMFDGGKTASNPRGNQPLPKAMPMQPMAQKPLKMYEDQSFEGDPTSFRTANPEYKFYEDNTFSAPQRLGVGKPQPQQSLRVQPSMSQPSGARYEDDYTATQAIQPTDYKRPQVSLNGGFMQGSLADELRRRFRF